MDEKKFNQKRNEIISKLKIDKTTLKDTDLPKFNSENIVERLTSEIYDSAFNQLVMAISEEEPDKPKNFVEAFVKVYFDFKIETVYNPKSLSYDVKVTPVWKAADMIDTESKEFKLLTEYVLMEDENND